ncbi:MAG: BON domain-containing protein [Pirellulaceae bacterium]
MRRNVLPLAILAAVALAPGMLLADDQQIAETIVERLSKEKEMGSLRDFELDLEVDSGQVWMKGRVANPQQQNLVLEVARRVPGVTQVVNDMAVVNADAAPEMTAESGIDLTPAHGESGAPRRTGLLANLGVPLPQASPSGSQQQEARTESRSNGLLAGFGTALQSVMRNRNDENVRQVANQQPLDSARRGMPAGAGMPQAYAAPQSVGTGVPPNSRLVPRGPMGPGGQMVPGGQMAGPGQMAPPGYYGQPRQAPRNTMPLAFAAAQGADPRMADARNAALHQVGGAMGPGGPMGPGGMMGPGGPQPTPTYVPGGGNVTPATYDHPSMPNYAWPSYASSPNYAALTYPKQYSPTAWPYIGPFYPYPQVPLGWRKVTLEWDDGWWFLDFNDGSKRRLFRR